MKAGHRWMLLVVFVVSALAFVQPGSALAGVRPPRPTPAPSLSVQITSPAAGAVLRPGISITVQTTGSVARVEYSLVSSSYVGLTESYLGSSTTAPFAFTWNGYASAVISGGGPYRLMARVYNAQNAQVTNEIAVVVPGTFNGGYPPNPINTASTPATSAILGGTQIVGQAFNSAVRALVEFNGVGDYAEFPISAAIAGAYELTVGQYRLTGTKPLVRIEVNGQALANGVTMVRTVTDTNDFGRDGTTTAIAQLNAGANVVRLTTLDGNVLSVGSIRIAQPAP